MRMLMIVVTAAASVLFIGWAEAQVREPGEGFIKSKRPAVGSDFYVVRKGDSGKCSLVAGKPGDKPVGAVGDAPYASRKYATKALKSSPECKGGLANDDTDHQ